ncbi:family 62 putative glycoside hydrolase [Podospora fimiseda]|uniref:Alpha-L-arabinofuranosidase n=1 Tax=Podospora fimiseda TaxID=252190 RepID=A0AAN7BLI4_9PEZI|nr:family 62 putative glycoside hydrolase [Podospora fimiseda]
MQSTMRLSFLSLLTLGGSLATALPSTAPAMSLDSRQSSSSPASLFPQKFQWVSTPALVGPKPDSRKIAGIKDPSVVEIDGTYHVFASTAKEEGYNLVYFKFTDFNAANSSTFHYLDQAPLGTGYRAAPQVFWFEPHKLWYLIYQNGNAAYSTNPRIDDPKGWTAPKVFYPNGTPKIISDNIGNGYWVDMWVICDDKKCFLFSSDDNGQLYRSETSLARFPEGMTQPVIAMQARKEDLYEAACIYSLPDNKGYLMLVECIDKDGGRYFRSWTGTKIDGQWKELAASEENPFARWNNVRFEGNKVWSWSISHGELIRKGAKGLSQKLEIDPCDMRFMYQGLAPDADWSVYNALPWRLGMITLENPVC